MIDLRHGDMRDVLPTIEAESVHSVVTDPPYHLIPAGLHLRTRTRNGDGTDRTNQPNYKAGFMGAKWDGGSIAFDPDTWRAVHRVLKPGGFLLSFGGTRTQHRMICAIEDAGFEIRDVIAWIYGSGFPKSLDISKAIDRAAGAEREVVGYAEHPSGLHRGKIADYSPANADDFAPSLTAPATDAARQWNGWGTALKPSIELVCVARKPLSERTVAANVLRHSTGGINIDACRVGTTKRVPGSLRKGGHGEGWGHGCQDGTEGGHDPNLGRWPANLVHDSSPEVEAAFAAFGTSTSTGGQASLGAFRNGKIFGAGKDVTEKRDPGLGDTGTASRFFYTAKADKGDRADSRHPTIKPVDLIRWLTRLVTPPGGTVLDPFAGSGTTGEAAMLEGFDAILIEREAEHAADIQHRQRRWHGGDLPLFAEAAD